MKKWLNWPRLWLCFVGLWLAGASGLWAQTPSVPTGMSLHWQVEYLEEMTATPLDLAHVQSRVVKGHFRPIQIADNNINLGFSQRGQWLLVNIHHPSTTASTWVLELAYQAPDWVDLYMPDGSQVLAGSLRSRPKEQLEHRFFSVPIRLEPGHNQLLMRVQSDAALTVPLRLWAPTDFLRHVQRSSVLQALYFGALAAMTLYNLFLAISLRDKRFGLYVLFALMLGAGMLSGNGYGRLYLWPEALAFDRVAQTFFLCLAGVFSLAFSRAFLQLDQKMIWIARSLRLAEVLMFGFALYFLGSVLLGWQLQMTYVLLIALAAPTGLLILVACARALRQGVKGTRFFILAWTVLWIGVFTAAFRMLGWVPSNFLTLYALQISSVLEMLLLAFALADIVHQERAQRDIAQSTALRLEQNLVTQLQASEERLEQAVLTRTSQLQEVLEKRQLLLDQYVRFGSLISHEFRNPLSIVQSQISVLRRQSPSPNEEVSRRLEIMSSATQRLLQLFDRWLQGGRLHHLEKDLHIENLQIDRWLQHFLHSNPQYHASHHLIMEKVIAAKVSPANLNWEIRADESLLEIAVHNLLDNACKYAEPATAVRIELRRDLGRIGIAIVDQGPGISIEQQATIFDDYVRLQPEGSVQGIGLGLAFVRRIAFLLEGSIELHSLAGQGSTFCLWLPSHSAKNPS